MAFKKTKDLAVVTGKYTKDGQEKNRYENIGYELEDETGAKMVFIKRSFNPAGVPFKEGTDHILVSRFEVKDGNTQQVTSSPASQPVNTGGSQVGDIPF